MYRLIWTAIANQQPISAIYKSATACFAPTGWAWQSLGQPRCVLCYQYGGESESGLAPIGSPENWRCIVFEKLKQVELLSGSWKTAPNHSPAAATCVVDADIDAEDQPERRATRKGTRAIPPIRRWARNHPQGSDGARIMPLGTDAANHAARKSGGCSGAGSPRLPIRAEEAQNDSVRPPGIHRPRCITWRDDGSRAIRVLRSGPTRVPV